MKLKLLDSVDFRMDSITYMKEHCLCQGQSDTSSWNWNHIAFLQHSNTLNVMNTLNTPTVSLKFFHGLMLYQLISAPAQLPQITELNVGTAQQAQQHSPGRPEPTRCQPCGPLELAADFCQSSPLVSGRPSKSRGGLDLKRVRRKNSILDPTKNSKCSKCSKCSLCKSVNRFNLWVLKFERWNAMTNDDESTASATSTLPLMDQIDPLSHLIPQSHGRLSAGAGEFLNFGSTTSPRHLLLGQLLWHQEVEYPRLLKFKLSSGSTGWGHNWHWQRWILSQPSQRPQIFNKNCPRKTPTPTILMDP